MFGFNSLSSDPQVVAMPMWPTHLQKYIFCSQQNLESLRISLLDNFKVFFKLSFYENFFKSTKVFLIAQNFLLKLKERRRMAGHRGPVV